MTSKVSIISVNYNGVKLLGDFLDSVKLQNYPKALIETIVVDNGSHDGSVEYLRNNYPWVKIVVSKKNLGFGGGNNLGIKYSKGSFLLLVNNDTYLDEHCLTNLIKTFEKWSKKNKVGAVSAKMI